MKVGAPGQGVVPDTESPEGQTDQNDQPPHQDVDLSTITARLDEIYSQQQEILNLLRGQVGDSDEQRADG